MTATATATAAALSVPHVTPDQDTLSAALAYAAAGLYVGPVKAGTKNPGSVLGGGWQRLTSRSPDVIAAWFAGTDHGVFIHCGRSGLLVFDVDRPELVPPVLAQAFAEHHPPYQTTRRTGDARRGHYLFAQPPGRDLGNGTGRLGGEWGEVRGRNGVIIVAPSVHEDAASGGLYAWQRTESVPVVPATIGDQLDDATDADAPATDAQVASFMAEHATDTPGRPELLDVWLHTYTSKVSAGESRHGRMVSVLTGAMKEAAAGLLDAPTAADTLESVFLTAVARPPASRGQGQPRTGATARSEWAGLLAWAVAQAQAADPAATQVRAESKVPPVDLRQLEPDPAGWEASSGGKKSVATQLVDLALDRWRFGVSSEGEPFALPLHGAQVVRMLTGSRSIRAELGDLFQARTGKVAGQQALADAVLTLEGRARRVEPVPLALRVAGDDDGVWLDLGALTGEAVKITGTGWQVEPEPPILFRRTALSGVLPQPVTGGDLAELWTLLNVAPESRPVLLAWLVAALLPEVPHPVAALVGEQGTGKSTASRMLTGLLDPSPAQLRKPPRDVDGWTTAAAGSWVVGVDNVSAVSDWWSDSLCRAVTGDGDVRRRLYSDSDLTVFAFKRVVLLNGVDLGTVRDDLADRLLTVELHRITDRQLDADIAHAWAQAHPRILGALLDLAVRVLRVLPGMTVADLPRMADFARVLAAVDQVLGTDGLATYRQLAADLAADAVTGDPVLAAITATLHGPWQGTAAELLDLLGDRPEHGKAWPRSARALTTILRRRAPSLRRLGWAVDDLGRGGHDKALRFLLCPPNGPEAAGKSAGNVRAKRATCGQVAGNVNTVARTPSPPVTSTDTERAGVAGKAGKKTRALLLDQTEKREESARDEIGRDSLPALPATPADDLDDSCPDCGRDLGADPAPACAYRLHTQGVLP